MQTTMILFHVLTNVKSELSVYKKNYFFKISKSYLSVKSKISKGKIDKTDMNVQSKYQKRHNKLTIVESKLSPYHQPT